MEFIAVVVGINHLALYFDDARVATRFKGRYVDMKRGSAYPLQVTLQKNGGAFRGNILDETTVCAQPINRDHYMPFDAVALFTAVFLAFWYGGRDGFGQSGR